MGTMTQVDENFSKMTEEERVQYFVDLENAREGDLSKEVYDCKICLNKGKIAVVQREATYITESTQICKCMQTRQIIHNANNSGMGDLLKHRLSHYKANEEWQKSVLESANMYLKDKTNCWFAMLGQSGSGKTMICASIANVLLGRHQLVKFVLESANMYLKDKTNCWFAMLGQSGSGKTMICASIANVLLGRHQLVKFMTWTEFTEKLKRMRFDADRDEYFDEFSKVEVLYIDDFLKGTVSVNSDGSYQVNQTDVKYAFQLINERYNKRLVTIISSEFLIDDIRECVDEAIAGRINERCREFCLQIRKDKNKNYRFKQGVVL